MAAPATVRVYSRNTAERTVIPPFRPKSSEHPTITAVHPDCLGAGASESPSPSELLKRRARQSGLDACTRASGTTAQRIRLEIEERLNLLDILEEAPAQPDVIAFEAPTDRRSLEGANNPSSGRLSRMYESAAVEITPHHNTNIQNNSPGPLPNPVIVSREVQRDTEYGGEINQSDLLRLLRNGDVEPIRTPLPPINIRNFEDSSSYGTNIPVSSNQLLRVSKETYVGILKEWSPPSDIEHEWDEKIRPKLLLDLQPALRCLPRDMPCEKTMFEAELCMVGQLNGRATTVDLKPTVWITCRSRRCKKAIRVEVKRLSYIRLFSQGPVQVRIRGPRLAGEIVDKGDNAKLHILIPDKQSPIQAQDRSDWSRLEIIPNSSSACGLRLKRIFTDKGCNHSKISSFGGLIQVGEEIWGLTTAHGMIGDEFMDVLKSQDAHYLSGGPQKSFTGEFSSPESASSDSEQEPDEEDSTQEVSASSLTPTSLYQTPYQRAYHGPMAFCGYGRNPESGLVTAPQSADFALVSVDNTIELKNTYREPRDLNITEIRGIFGEDELEPGPVYVLSGENEAQEGYLLRAKSSFVVMNTVFQTRKIQMAKPLAPGKSGSWVVRSDRLCGCVVAVYDQDPYIHMITAKKMFSDIEQFMSMPVRVASCHMSVASASLGEPFLSSRTELATETVISSNPSSAQGPSAVWPPVTIAGVNRRKSDDIVRDFTAPLREERGRNALYWPTETSKVMNDESPQNDDWELVPMEYFLSNNEKDKFRWDDYLKSLAEMLPYWEYKPTGSRHVCLPPQNMRSRFPMVWRENLGSSRKAMVWECVAPPAIYQTYKHRLAVKVLSCRAFESPVTEALEEVRNMEDIEHCHIVSYVASYESAEKLGIIMYPPAKCNLDEYMRPVSQELAEISQIESGMPRACLSPESRQKIKHLYRFFGCLSEAIRYLHATAVGIKHKDIKPANIVVDHFNSPLLTDFSIAHRYASPEEVDTSGYTNKTKKYACPEALDEESRNYSADIFSLGCVFLEIVTISLEVPLDDLYSHLTDAGNDTIYATTLSKIPGWMDVLRAKHGSNNDADGKEVDSERQEMITSLINILPVIEDMMAKKRERRPSARFLCEKFGAMYSKPCRSCAWRPREQKMPTPNQSPPVSSPNAGPAERGETQDKTDKRRSKAQNIHAEVIFYDSLNTKATIERFENIKCFKTTRIRFKPFRRFVKVKIAGQEHSVIDLKKLGWHIFLRCLIGDINYIHVLGEIKESSARTDRSGPG